MLFLFHDDHGCWDRDDSKEEIEAPTVRQTKPKAKGEDGKPKTYREGVGINRVRHSPAFIQVIESSKFQENLFFVCEWSD